jgi:protein TonB
MKRKNEKVPGFDEIIFENRNKEYGAYYLRKKNLPATFWSIIGAVALFSAIIIAIFISIEEDAIADKHEMLIVIANYDNTISDINKLKQETPPEPKLLVKPTPYVVPEIVEKLDSNDRTMVAVSSLDTTRNRPVENNVIQENETVNAVVPEPEPEPFVSVKEMPEFPGGEKALFKYINDNTVYPEKAIDNRIEGKVILRFVVSKEGFVKRIQILRGVDPVLDQEAVRVISEMPRWKPGKNNGAPVAVWYSVPVTFRILSEF